MRRLFAALAAVCFFSIGANAADIVRGKRVVIIRGLGGEVLAPMYDLAAALRAKGYSVRLASMYFEGARDADVLIVHSMPCFNALNSRAPVIITIDCPFWAGMVLPSAPRGSRVYNFYTWLHPKIDGAKNYRISGVPLIGHVAAPKIAQRRILSLL